MVALKSLGFTLEQVRRLLAEPVGAGELRGMLQLRRAQLEEEAHAVGTRLAAVESRLAMIEKEHLMTTDFVVKTIPAVRLTARTATLDPDTLGQHVGGMFDAVAADIGHICGSLATPIATYAEADEGTEVVAGYAYSGPTPPGAEIVDLPSVTAVCGVHLGPMADIRQTWQALHRWVLDQGYRYAGPCRELYVRAESDDQADWVTELQQPVAR